MPWTWYSCDVTHSTLSVHNKPLIRPEQRQVVRVLNDLSQRLKVAGALRRLQSLIRRTVSNCNRYNSSSIVTMAQDDYLWSFGYGSNMDQAAVEHKKNCKVIEHTPAILRGFRLSFDLHAMALVEPAFANVREEEGAEVHGVAFCMDAENVAKLDSVERGYNKKMVTLEAYDGRQLHGFVYISKKELESDKEWAPSARYLGILVKGARQAGLKPEYIERLASMATYQPAEWVLRMRAARPDPASLRPITVDELAEHGPDSSETWISCLGYVVRPVAAMFFNAHKGRDITARSLLHFNGISLDDHDDRGRPPYPLVSAMKPGELEFITTWLDQYQAGKSPDEGQTNTGEIVGYLKEFREQQLSGKTTYVMPDIPEFVAS